MKIPLRIRQSSTSNAAVAVNILAPAVKPGEIWRVRHAALDNESGESVKVAFGITDIGGLLRIAAIATVATGDAGSIFTDVLLTEGDRLTAQVTGTADKGPVTLFVSGEILRPDTVVEVVAVAP